MKQIDIVYVYRSMSHRSLFSKSSMIDSSWVDEGPLCGCLGSGCSDTIWPRNGTNLAEISTYYGYGESNYGYDEYDNYLPMDDSVYDDKELQFIKDWIHHRKCLCLNAVHIFNGP